MLLQRAGSWALALAVLAGGVLALRLLVAWVTEDPGALVCAQNDAFCQTDSNLQMLHNQVCPCVERSDFGRT